MKKKDKSHQSAQRRRGFTLVELLVVISVIVVLLGLTVAVASMTVQRSETRETEMILTTLDMMVQEYEAEADRRLSWGKSGWTANGIRNPRVRYDLNDGTPDFFVLSEVLETVLTAPTARAMLERIPAERLYQYEANEVPQWMVNRPEAEHIPDFAGTYAVLDAWGMPVYSTHPGRAWHSSDAAALRDEDGTIRTGYEQRYGVTRNRRICFVSAGPDRDFGWMGGGDYVTEAMREATRDNIASYQPVDPIYSADHDDDSSGGMDY